MTSHFVVPDLQVKPGVPLDHLTWIGEYAAERLPDVIIQLGDFWDMPSLSSYDRGRKAAEGRRYTDDVEAGNKAMELLTAPIRKAKLRNRKWKPRLVLLRGNHEDRIRRAIEDDARMDGAMSFDDLKSPGWEVHDFLEPVFIDGIGYSHYWANPMSGRPIGGMIETRLKTIGHSFTAGHQQTLQTGIRFIQGPDGPVQQRGLIVGAGYLHTEDFLGLQGNAHWRGVIVKHAVDGFGGYDLMEVSLDFLSRKYAGCSLVDFMQVNYPEIGYR